MDTHDFLLPVLRDVGDGGDVGDDVGDVGDGGDDVGDVGDGDVGEDVGDVGDGEDFGDAGGVGGADVVGDADGVGDGEDNGEIWVVVLAGAGTAATRDFSVTAGDASFTTGSLAVSTEVAACFFMVST